MQNLIKCQGNHSPLEKPGRKMWRENQMSEPIRKLKNEGNLSFAITDLLVTRPCCLGDQTSWNEMLPWRHFSESELVKDLTEPASCNSCWWQEVSDIWVTPWCQCRFVCSRWIPSAFVLSLCGACTSGFTWGLTSGLPPWPSDLELQS